MRGKDEAGLYAGRQATTNTQKQDRREPKRERGDFAIARFISVSCGQAPKLRAKLARSPRRAYMPL